VNTLLALVVALILSTWFGGLAVQLWREIAEARGRRRLAWTKEQKLLTMIQRMLEEEKALTRQIDDETEADTKLQNQLNSVRGDTVKRQASGGKRLLVVNSRRQSADRDWIVTLACPTPARPDSHPAVTQEWARGRDYLIWARTEFEARERALRRFHNRPDMVVKAITAAPPDLLTGEVVAPASPTPLPAAPR
jgi:hypothetical protein